LRSVIFNLVSNALKYSSADRTPEILIKSFQQDEFLVISVADNGIGSETNNQVTIFEKYNRITNDVEGNGVGLYVVKQILEGGGGKITVDSTSRSGSVFSVYINQSGN
jgi:two-component system phosphate regulon sensor histidine kinase PhoR